MGIDGIKINSTLISLSMFLLPSSKSPLQYRPTRLDKLVFHSDIGEALQKLVRGGEREKRKKMKRSIESIVVVVVVVVEFRKEKKTLDLTTLSLFLNFYQVSAGDCPHTLFYGPPGAGKTTLLKATLRELYGASADRVKVETAPWKITTPSRTLEVELTTVSSAVHVELTPADAGTHDRYVVQEVIKEIARARPVDARGNRSFKVLVLHEVDRLSRDAQAALRRTMESHSGACRLLMASSSLSRVIEPLRSRCLCVRVPAPTEGDIETLLAHVAKKESLSLPGPLAKRVVAASNRSARRALLALETARVACYPFTDNQEVELPDWELYAKETAAEVLLEQSPRALYVARGKVYELLVNCVPPDLVLRTLAREIRNRLREAADRAAAKSRAATAGGAAAGIVNQSGPTTDAALDPLKAKIARSAAQFKHRMAQGSKPVFHIEAFLARFMVDFKEWQMAAERQGVAGRR